MVPGREHGGRARGEAPRLALELAGNPKDGATQVNQLFTALLADLEPKYQKLLEMPPVPAADIRSGTPKGGVYLFSEGDLHLYVGRTKRHIHIRIRDHFGANRDAASFPWLIARENTGMKATYRQIRSRKSYSQSRSSGRLTMRPRREFAR